MSQQEKAPLQKYQVKFTAVYVNYSSAGKEYLTGYALIADAAGQESSYKCMSFRSAVIDQVKHLGVTAENPKAVNNQPAVVEGYFKQNDRQGKDYGKYELFFDNLNFLDPSWAPISAWFNDPANQRK